MKAGQVAALVAGVTLGVAGVTLGVVLARKEGRDAAMRFIEENRLRERGTAAAQQLATSARKVGEQVARTAAEQYQAQMPRAREALAGVVSRTGMNGKSGEPQPPTPSI